MTDITNMSKDALAAQLARLKDRREGRTPYAADFADQKPGWGRDPDELEPVPGVDVPMPSKEEADALLAKRRGQATGQAQVKPVEAMPSAKPLVREASSPEVRQASPKPEKNRGPLPSSHPECQRCLESKRRLREAAVERRKHLAQTRMQLSDALAEIAALKKSLKSI